MTAKENNLKQFVDGCLEGIYKIGTVSTTKGQDNMHDRGWQLTKAAQKEFEQVVSEWFERNYKDLCRLAAFGDSFYAFGCWFICSVQGCGTGFFDAHLGIPADEVRNKLKRLGNKLHKSVQSSFQSNEVFNLYIVRGKHCAFEFPLVTNASV